MTETKSVIPFSVWRKIAMATWRPRTDPTISATIDIEAPHLLEYIDQVRRATGQHLTPVDLVGRAAGKVVEALPGLNGRVVFGSFLPVPHHRLLLRRIASDRSGIRNRGSQHRSIGHRCAPHSMKSRPGRWPGGTGRSCRPHPP